MLRNSPFKIMETLPIILSLCHAMMPTHLLDGDIFHKNILNLFLSNGDIFHDAIHSDTNLDPTILNLLNRNDDILDLEKNDQDLDL